MLTAPWLARRWRSVAGVAVTTLIPALGAGVALSADAGADPARLSQALVAVRSGTSCGPLQHNSTVEHVADIVNRSTVAYLTHSAENVPADEPHPTALLKDLGIHTEKVISLQGAGKDEHDAVEALLVQGYNSIPDCSYNEFGVSQIYEPQTGYHLVVAVLVGN